LTFDDKIGIILDPSDVIVLPNLRSRTDTLARRGIVDHPDLEVRAIKPDDGLWRVAISGRGNPLTALDFGGATKLVEELRAVGEEKLATEINSAAAEARRLQLQGA